MKPLFLKLALMGASPSVCLAPHMASLTFPVKVWVVPAAIVGTKANSALRITVAIKTCNIRKRDIDPPVYSQTSATLRP